MMKKKTSEPFDLGSVDAAKSQGQESYPENQNSREAELVSRSPSQQGGRQGDLHENLTGASGPIEGELKVPDRSIIAPGEVLATGMGYLPALGTLSSPSIGPLAPVRFAPVRFSCRSPCRPPCWEGERETSSLSRLF